MQIFGRKGGCRMYLTDDFSLAGAFQKNRWVIRDLFSPEREYRFPSEEMLLAFLTWVEESADPARRLRALFLNPA